MIPKKIWQTWKGPYTKLPTVMGHDLRKLTESWIKLNPGYTYYYCDDEECLSMIRQKDPELYQCVLECNRVNVVSMKSDIFRYFVLYEYGGFYADIDTVCCVPIKKWLKPDIRFILSPEDTSIYFQQWFLGSEKGHPLLKALLDNIKRKFKEGIDYSDADFVHISTGPSIFTHSILDFLGIEKRDELRELSAGYNKLAKVRDLGVFIYDDYRYFREGKPHGVVWHLYASIFWFEANYDNWRTQAAVQSNVA